MRTLLENSIQDTNKQLAETLNPLYETETKSGNLDAYQGLLTDIIERNYVIEDFSNVCSVIEPKIPDGKIPFIQTEYIGKDSDNLTITDDIKIFLVQDSSAFTEGDDISTASATGTVLYVEEGKLLVNVLTGTFAPTNDIDNAIPFSVAKTSITLIYEAIHSAGILLQNYGGEYITASGEVLTDFKQVSYKISNVDIQCKTSKIETGYTIELMQDLISLYGMNIKDTITKSLSKIINQNELQNIYAFQRSNAIQRPNIVLTNSYGVQGNIADIYNDLYSRINQSIGNIGTNTGIVGKHAVICSSNIFAALKTAKDVTHDKKDLLNNGALLIEDGYAIKDYLLVTLIGPDNQGGVIYTPYHFMIKSVTNMNFQNQVIAMLRRDIVNNPLATMQSGKNEMMELTYVDGFSDLIGNY